MRLLAAILILLATTPALAAPLYLFSSLELRDGQLRCVYTPNRDWYVRDATPSYASDPEVFLVLNVRGRRCPSIIEASDYEWEGTPR